MITIEELCADNHKLVDENLKLRKENKELRDNYEQYKAVAEPEIAALKNEIINLKGVIESLSEQRDRLEKENAELKEQNANLIAMLKSEREVRVNDDYLKGICERDAEIDGLKEQLECAEHNRKVKQEFNDNQFNAIMDFRKRAKEILRNLLDSSNKTQTFDTEEEGQMWIDSVKEAEEFLKECE